MNKTPRNEVTVRSARMSRLAPALACIFTVLGLPVHAAVSLPDTPIQTNNGLAPNIWFILDDSGSMAWRYMYNPDIASLIRDGATVVSTRTGNNTGTDSTYGSNSTNLLAMYDQSYVTNTIYYNPHTIYRGWQNADASYMGNRAYNSVLTSNTLVDANVGSLTGEVQTFYVPLALNTNDARQYARFTFETDGTAGRCVWTVADNAFTTCTTETSFNWSGVIRDVAQEKQNFANWFSYHRTRSKVAKAGASYAFNDPDVFNADNQYRVGYTTIWAGGNGLPDQTFRIPVATSNGEFTGANRDTWFSRLFATGATNATPLIPALTRAGQYFEETDANGPWGPQANGSQYECRQNFTILTTDGYWNSGATVVGNSDDTAGALITRPPLASYTYAPVRPYMDNWSNTLADVAMHYWNRDLRPETVMTNTVPTSATNIAFWQHMVTFGISIGLKGTLDPKTDLPDLISGVKVWPQPVANTITTIDDLFHASVNGRGKFVTAGNPQEFADGLGSALRAISDSIGSGSNATVTGTSTAAGTKVFQASYFSLGWYGALKAFPVTAAGTDTATTLWTASIPAFATRNIYTHNGSAGTSFPTAAQSTALTPDVANYIRGDRSKEQPDTTPSTGRILRKRTSLLGTIVNSSPTYVKNADTVYAGANDGMLHAFDGTSGAERFAYVPRGINLVKLKEYSEPDYNHGFFVDGPLVVSTDRELTGQKVLVGTLGRGGKGLFALDVTNPATFGPTRVLWDRSGNFDADVGQILGKPLIAKLNDGSTAVIVPNGLNSNNEDSVLLVYDLRTGVEIKRLSTGNTTNNGLSSPRGWDEDGNGTIDTIYAGDFQGNVWKFDLSSSSKTAWKVAKKLFAPTTAGDHPVTGGVTIAVDPATDMRWVFFGTGRFLTANDITNKTLQTWYGVIDDIAVTASVTRTGLTARNIAQVSGNNRAFEPNSILPTNSKGWYIDLDQPPTNEEQGERMVGEQQVVKNVLISASIIPIPNTGNPCQPGRGYINAIDAFTGTSLKTGLFDANRDGTFGGAGDKLGSDAVGSIDLGVGMVTDPALLDKLLVAGGSLATLASTPLDPALYGGRISWREIIRR